MKREMCDERLELLAEDVVVAGRGVVVDGWIVWMEGMEVREYFLPFLEKLVRRLFCFASGVGRLEEAGGEWRLPQIFYVMLSVF
jgi:hypothetical protein